MVITHSRALAALVLTVLVMALLLASADPAAAGGDTQSARGRELVCVRVGVDAAVDATVDAIHGHLHQIQAFQRLVATADADVIARITDGHLSRGWRDVCHRHVSTR
jgi:hypothetical protein